MTIQIPKVYLTLKQLIVISVVVVYFTVLWMGRYTVVPVSSNPSGVTAYKLDRWTGQVWFIHRTDRGLRSRLVR